MVATELEVVDSLDAVSPVEWDSLAGDNPFLRYAFLHAMHETGCASRKTGWIPRYLILRTGTTLTGAMPLYLKGHSRGEYVFDHSWADAFYQHGIRYYPKLLSAIPFTPVTGPRLLAHSLEHKRLLALGAVQLAKQLEVSSLHILFPDDGDKQVLEDIGYMLRSGVQFHWTNAGYSDFEAFLATMNQEKRKKVRQDSRKVAEAGIGFRWLRGGEIADADLRFFYRCYELTYQAHGSSPYLNLEFFRRILAAMPESVLVVLAERDGSPVAAALNVIGENVLYGRYWGTTEFVPGLHFETCYAQAIRWCIANRVDSFEGGAQGEHKMARGLLPTPTYSAHWISDNRFAAAISDFLERETSVIADYRAELGEHAPFRKLS
ncbi:GNAT family N-acetyltransferase [Ralstonia sp. 11b]|uniref:GNAT family N-acetyltransferase n=1 Tax=Ralstonia sp. 11b TaxID=3063544 RepID=UPI00286FB8FF|nr:GNAT family N-acetyltransferase [Ralstonia sp. 11b]MDR9384173.1 GNAT family N-acetyltransferase [Ralstonia sp. 11b]